MLLAALQWRQNKLAPCQYDDSLALKHSGGIASVPIEVDDEHARRIAQAVLDGIANEG